ncbi:MAG: response regulator, partial [Verrucomicrobiota bacterium]
EEAISQWEEHRPDLILMDKRMPKVDGYQAAEAIRNSKTVSHHAPPCILMVTADALTDDETQKVQQQHATVIDGYIPKPFDIREVSQLVASHLSKRATA